MRATITDVARQAGVSMKTVSRVLNNEPNVAEKTRERVLGIARDLRYTPNLAAKGLASSKSYLIALIYDHISPNYIADIQRGAIDACRKNNFHLIVEPFSVEGASASDDLVRILEKMPVDGVILVPPLSDNAEIKDILKRQGIAVMPVSPSRPDSDTGCVTMDDERAAIEMTQYLVEKGHKKIGFIKGPEAHSVSATRYDGFRRALDMAGLTVNPDWIGEGDFTFRSGVAAAERILQAENRPSAIFASNDDMAVGVVSAASKLGIAVPEELAVGGFDDTPIAQMLWPQITTIKQPIYEMGCRAAKLLIDPDREGDGPSIIKLDHQLIIRGSA